MQTRQRVLGAVVVLTVAVSIGLPLVGVGSFHAADTIGIMAPWSEETPYDFRPDNTQVTDTVNAVVPMRTAFRDRVYDGDLPLWDPLQGTGAPLATQPNVGVFSPLTLPYLVAPVWLAPMLTKVIEAVVAVLGMYLLARRWGLSRSAALVGGLAFVNSGFLVAWTNWPQSHVGALIPLLFWAVERGVTASRHREVWPLALVGAVMWLEGFPSVTVYAFVTAGVYGAVRAYAVHGPTRRAVRRLSALAGAVLLSLALAAFQLIPFFLRLRVVELNREGLAGRSLPWEFLTTLAAPDALGNPVERVYYGPLNYVEGQSWAGVTVLVLVALLLVARRRLELPRGVVGFIVGAGVTGVIVVYLGTPVLDLIGEIPLVGTNFIGRYRAVLAVLLAGAAAAGYDAFVDVLVAEERWRRPVVTALAAVGAGLLVLATVSFVRAAAADRLSYAVVQWTVPLLVALLCGLVVLSSVAGRSVSWRAVAAVAAVLGAVVAAAAAVTLGVEAGLELVALGLREGASGIVVAVVATVLVAVTAWAMRDREAVAVAAVLIPVLLAAEAVAFAYPWFARTPLDLFYPATPTHEFLSANIGSDRIAAADDTLYAGTNAMYGLRSLTAHAHVPPETRAYLSTIDDQAFARSSSLPFLSAAPTVATSTLLDRAGVRYWAVAPTDPLYGEVAPGVTGDAPLALASVGAATAPIAPGPARGVTLDYLGSSDLAGTPSVFVEVRDGRGALVVVGSTRLHDWVRPGPLPVAFGEVDVPPDATISVGVEGATEGQVLLASDGVRPAFERVRPLDDGLRIAHAEGAVVYERTMALPRIRWAGRSAPVPDAAARLDALVSGVPDDLVVLGPGGTTDDEPDAAVLDVVEDSGDVIVVDVDAQGAGHLVVADSILDGWRAEVDGGHAELVSADHAFAAVPVPAGIHRIRLEYDPPGWSIGLGVTAIALLVVSVLVVADRGLARRMRRPSTSTTTAVKADG